MGNLILIRDDFEIKRLEILQMARKNSYTIQRGDTFHKEDK